MAGSHGNRWRFKVRLALSAVSLQTNSLFIGRSSLCCIVKVWLVSLARPFSSSACTLKQTKLHQSLRCHHLQVSNLILIHIPPGRWRRRLRRWEICHRGEGYGSVLWSADSEWQDSSPVSLCATGLQYLIVALTRRPLTPPARSFSCHLNLLKPESAAGGRKWACIKRLNPGIIKLLFLLFVSEIRGQIQLKGHES